MLASTKETATRNETTRMPPESPPTKARKYCACFSYGIGLSLVFLGDFANTAMIAAYSTDAGGAVALPVIAAAPHSVFAVLITIISATSSLVSKRNLSYASGATLLVAFVYVGFAAIAGTPLDIGFTVVASSLVSAILIIQYLLEATAFSSIWAKRCIICGILFEACVKFLIPDALISNVGALYGSYACALAIFWLTAPLRKTLYFPMARWHATSSNPKSLFGFLAITICAAVTLQIITDSEQYSNALYAVGLVIAALVIWRTLAAKTFPSYSSLLKISVTLFVTSFALFPLLPSLSSLLSLIALSAGSLFWFGVVIFAIEAAALSKKKPSTIIAGMYALLSCRGLIEPLFTLVFPSWKDTIDLNVLCGAIVITLTIASLWLLGEKDIDSLLPRSIAVKPDKEHPDATRSNLDEISMQYGITAKEQEILFLYAKGRSAPYIAEKLFISVNTVKTHLANIYQKMDIHSRQKLISLVHGAGEDVEEQ